MTKIITIIIDETGNQTAETGGYQGKGCEAVLKAFAGAVGATEKVTLKPEYYREPVKANLLKR